MTSLEVCDNFQSPCLVFTIFKQNCQYRFPIKNSHIDNLTCSREQCLQQNICGKPSSANLLYFKNKIKVIWTYIWHIIYRLQNHIQLYLKVLLDIILISIVFDLGSVVVNPGPTYLFRALITSPTTPEPFTTPKHFP